ncbi:MAG: DNA cytosine methyltransferase, partial [Bacillota bacterium]
MSQMLLAGCEPRRGTRRPMGISRELIVDNFAGGGGVSMGIERALGRGPDIAINHDPDAIHMHETNHPHASHYCENVWDIDPLEATKGCPVGLAWFSPDCRHFSRAKGAKPLQKKIRGLAWIVLRWAAKAKPRVIILENVREFAEWGPLNRSHRPIKAKIGVTFRRWVQQLRNLGYAVEWRVLNAADYGAPTHRRRLFVIARRDGEPITWPEATHGKGRLPYRTAAECINWSIPTQPIFGRKKPLAPKTMKRIMEGLRRYVIECPNPFIAPVGPAFLVKFRGLKGSLGVNEPLHTICAGAATFALAVPYLAMLGQTGGNGHRVFPVTQPARTIISKNEHLLCAAFLVKYYGTAKGAPVTEPLH